MSETTGKTVVSLLENHVDHVITTVKNLRDEKHELEAEIVRLNNDVIQRDAKIQELENLNADLRDEAEKEREEIRQQLKGLMSGLKDPDAETENASETPEENEAEVMFKANS